MASLRGLVLSVARRGANTHLFRDIYLSCGLPEWGRGEAAVRNLSIEPFPRLGSLRGSALKHRRLLGM